MPEIKIGSIVHLMSGGNSMTVVGIGDETDPQIDVDPAEEPIHCVWHSEDGYPQRDSYPRAALI